MRLILTLCGLVALAELALWLPALWVRRKLLSEYVALLTALTSAILLATDFSAWQWLFAVLSGYRVFNLVRMYKGQIHPDYLFHSAERASRWLIGGQIAVVVMAWLVHQLGLTTDQMSLLVSIGALLGSLIILASTLRHQKTTQAPHLTTSLTRQDLPTVTVAIPARNETTDLEACLRSLVASTYPKLEILVLDDCSQTTRTPEIIRSFAHDGVRFIAGETPPERWLAKNFAYEQLAAQASGEYLLFCGVDARFEPQSLQMLVETMLAKQKTMLSVIPRNAPTGVRSVLVQTGRYAWELVLPRRWLERPPVLSTCWLIKASTLKAAGGLEAVCRSVQPERYLAKWAASHSDGYSFIASNEQLGVSSHKSFAEQQATAVRTRYPSLHRCPERVAVASLAELMVLLAPIYCLVFGLIKHQWLVAGTAGLAYAACCLTYALVYQQTYHRRFVPAGLCMPFTTLYDIALLHVSMYRYEFGEVLWKGRNVCVPVMHVVPKLPSV